MRANHKRKWVELKTGKGIIEVEVQPGQFVFGRHSAAKDLSMNPNTVWKRMQKLKNLENLNIESNTQYSIITITNWHSYQVDEKESNIESNKQVTSKEQASNTDKNDKNVNTYTDDFLEFWQAYPKKVGKGAAWSAWKKTKKQRPPNGRVVEAVNTQKRSDQWSRNGGQYIPNPATWLNQHRWEDEASPPKPPGPSTALPTEEEEKAEQQRLKEMFK